MSIYRQQLASDAIAFWHWLSADGIAVVAIVNLVFLGCTVFLAVLLLHQSRRVRGMAALAEKHAGLLALFAGELEISRGAWERWSVAPSPLPAPEAPSAHKEEADRMTAAEARKEFDALRHEVASLRTLISDASADRASAGGAAEFRAAAGVRDEIERLKAHLCENPPGQPARMEYEDRRPEMPVPVAADADRNAQSEIPSY